MTYIINQYITEDLLSFLNITDIINFGQINRSINGIIQNSKIYNQIHQLKGTSKDEYLIECYKKGLLDVLKIYHYNNINIFEKSSIEKASANGHIDVLNWLKNNGFEFKYINDAINSASKKGHIAVLDWFKNSGFQFKYTNYTIDWASSNGYVAVLNWFKNSDFEFKYTSDAIYWASIYGHVAVLNWFKNNGYH